MELNGNEKGENLLAVEVAGYNVNSFYLVDRPPFLQAELLNNRGKVIASTGNEGAQFEGIVLNERVQKVQRYSFQRPFTEVYRLTSDFNEWRTDPKSRLKSLENEVQTPKKYLPRKVPYTWFTKMCPTSVISSGTLETNIQPANFWRDRPDSVGPQLGGFPETELTCIPSLELQTVANKDSETLNIPWDRENHLLELKGLEYRILDFGTNSSGFIGAKVEVNKDTRLFFTFDEILRDNDIDFKRLGCVNIIEYDLAPEPIFGIL